MANNRMYLCCGTCGSELMLAKYHPGAWWVWDDSDASIGKRLRDFIDEHSSFTHAPQGTDFMWGTDMFRLDYEICDSVAERRTFVGTAREKSKTTPDWTLEAENECGDGIDETTPLDWLKDWFGRYVRVTVERLKPRYAGEHGDDDGSE